MPDYLRTGAPYALGIGVQGTFDVYQAPTNYIPFQKFEPDYGISDKALEGHIGGRGTEIGMVRDKVLPKATLDASCWPDGQGLEQAIYGVLGAKAAPAQQGGTTAYKHAITEGASLPYFSLTHWAGPTINETIAYKNTLMDNVKIDYKEGEIDMNVSMFTAPADTSQSKPTATYGTAVPFTFKDFKCFIGGYGTQSFATTDVTVASDQITLALHNLNTGDPVQFSTTTTLPAGLSAATTYYVIYVDANTIKVATTLANAKAGTQIDITSQGTGTHTIDKGANSQETTVTAANIEINNNIITKAMANNSYDPLKIPGKLEVTGRLEFPMQNTDELKNYLGGNAQATTINNVIRYRNLKFQLTGALIASTYYYDLTITLPKVALVPVKISYDDAQPVSYGFDFRAFRNASNTMITADIISKLTSIT